MKCSEWLTLWQSQVGEQTQRLIGAVEGIDATALNTCRDQTLWNPAQVIEHMVLSHGPYLDAIEAALRRSNRSDGDPVAKLSFIGRMICQAAGPDGNVPAPKSLAPRTGRIPLTILDDWRAQQERLAELLRDAASRDLSGTRVQNPFVRVLPMNLTDCFAIIVAHTERHVRQAIARLPGPPSP